MAQEYKFERHYFGVVDYVVFVFMVLLSTGIGLFMAYKKPRKKPVDEAIPEGGQTKVHFGSKKMNEYLLGSRALKIFPVGMSLIASYISGVTMLGTPAEIYNYGTQYWMITVSIICMGFAVALIYLPVFHQLGVGSSYEYLELRFSSYMRSMASFMFVMDELFFLPIIVYVPSLAFNQVTGINIHYVSVSICVLTVLYTIFGGIKAVVHTDAWQIAIMFLAVFVVVIFGTVYAQGPGPVFSKAYEGGRIIFFNMSPSMYERQTFWGVIIGGFFYWTAFNSVNQTMVQRYMSLPTLRSAQYSIIIFIAGTTIFLSFCIYTGLLIYHYYQTCDPLTANLVKNPDQLLPEYVMTTVGHVYGIPGLFLAGVFGAALSSLSVVLNSTALVLMEDIVKGTFKVKLSERQATIMVKASIAILGVVALSMVFILEQMSSILSVATALTAIAASTSFGVFSLGMLFPWANSRGALCGAIAGLIMAGIVAFGTQIVLAMEYVVSPKLSVSVENCPGNLTLPEAPPRDESHIFSLFRLSFHWIAPIGITSTILVGIVASFIFKAQVVRELDANLLSPVIHRYLPKECFRSPSGEGHLLNETLKKENTK